MNIVKYNNKIYKLESVFRKTKDEKRYDNHKNIFPWPEKNKNKWQNQDDFVDKLEEIEKYLNKKKSYKHYKNKFTCLFNDHNKKNVSTKLYILDNIMWEDSLLHYITVHNVKPSEEFIEFIFNYIVPTTKPYLISRINGTRVIKYNKQYLKITRNQLFIFDALLEHGGNKQYIDANNKNNYKYSEHSGLLDFNKTGLEKVIVSAKTVRIDKEDENIYLPENMPEAFDYEFIYHTHPPTPVPGGRVKEGILYEFPSIHDLLHFIDHYNNGDTQGSFVFASEGLYIIRKQKFDDKAIDINEDALYEDYNEVFWNVEKEAIKKYTTNFNKETFYSKIAQDTKYIKKINDVLNKYKLYIEYFPRIKDKSNKWVIDTIYVPVYVNEPL